MQGDGDIVFDERSFHQFDQIRVVGISPGSFGNLQDKRSFQLSGRFRDPLYDLHVVHVERTDGVAAFICFLKHFSSCN